MSFFVKFLDVFLPALYFVTIWTYAKSAFSGSESADRLKTPLLISLVTAHAGYLVLRTRLFEHPPMTNVFEILSVISFCVAIAYAVMEFRTLHLASHEGAGVLVQRPQARVNDGDLAHLCVRPGGEENCRLGGTAARRKQTVP